MSGAAGGGRGIATRVTFRNESKQIDDQAYSQRSQ